MDSYKALCVKMNRLSQMVRLEGTIWSSLISIHKASQEFEKEIIKAISYDIEFLLIEYGVELNYILSRLLSYKDKVLTSFCDRILINKLNVNEFSRIQISDLFEKIIKGITYFMNQEPPLSFHSIIYHRLYSCGSKMEGNMLSCLSSMNKDELNKQKQRIKTCYIERLIFDALWKNEKFYFSQKGESPRQNPEHETRNKITREQYQSCFPLEDDIEIFIFTENLDDIPTRISITYTKKNGKQITETYIKEYFKNRRGGFEYHPFIDCVKVINDKKYIKFQSFIGEMKWLDYSSIAKSEITIKPSTLSFIKGHTV